MITSYSSVRIANTVEVTVTGTLSGTVYYHWWIDGVYAGRSLGPRWTFFVGPNQQARVEAIETSSAGFDPEASGPQTPAARRVLWWIASADGLAAAYRVEQQQDGGAWTSLGVTIAAAGAWTHFVVSDRLDDLADYAWRVVPIDAAGNEGPPRTIDAERIVRTPDAPAFTVSFDDQTQEATFAAA
jgi:hypothetical protein